VNTLRCTQETFVASNSCGDILPFFSTEPSIEAFVGGCLDSFRVMSQVALPYILAYKSQNLRQNLDRKVGGATYPWVIKYSNFFLAAEIRNSGLLLGRRAHVVHEALYC